MRVVSVGGCVRRLLICAFRAVVCRRRCVCACVCAGYYAEHLSFGQEIRGNATVRVKNESRGFHLNNLSYVGPIVMGFGGECALVRSCISNNIIIELLIESSEQSTAQSFVGSAAANGHLIFPFTFNTRKRPRRRFHRGRRLRDDVRGARFGRQSGAGALQSQHDVAHAAHQQLVAEDNRYDVVA